MDEAFQEFKKLIKKGGILTDKNVKICDVPFDINKNDLFGEALYLGYLDTCRNIEINKEIRTDRKKPYQDTSEDGIPNKLKNYFCVKAPNKQELFDLTHKELCKTLQEKYASDYKCDLKYGQAQKIVNMAFKYLYCCKGIDEKYFEYCHMPLDKFTLLWFGKITGIYITTWYVIEDNLYDQIQKRIRDYVKKEYSNQKNVLDVEFSVWKEIKENTYDLSYDKKKPNGQEQSIEKQNTIIDKIMENKD